jgi:FkbM family methyltransferase
VKQSLFIKVFLLLPLRVRRHSLIKWIIKIFPKERIATFLFNEHTVISADLADGAVRQVLITGIFEPEFFKIANAFIIPESVVIDIGANNGFCTFGLLSKRDNSINIKFHLFEANRHLCAILTQSAKAYFPVDIIVNNRCVTNKAGVSTLYIDEKNWGASHISQNLDGQIVENIIIDEYLQDNQISVVSFLKMDIEGFELNAIEGMKESIKKGVIGAMYIECASSALARQSSNPEELLNLLRSYGCEIFWCKPQDFSLKFENPIKYKDVFPILGGTSVKLAILEDFPSDYQTDILAIPATGLYSHVIDFFR